MNPALNLVASLLQLPFAGAPAPASAPPPQVETQAAAAPTDLVVLKAGGMVRGTVLSSVVGEPVHVQLADGTARKFDFDAVAYAGPASAFVSTPVAATPRVDPGLVRVRFVGEEKDLVLYRHAGRSLSRGSGHGKTEDFSFRVRTENWERVCAAPCEATVNGTEQRFAIGQGDEDPVDAGALRLNTDAEILGAYEDNTLERVVLIGSGVAAMVAGGLVLADDKKSYLGGGLLLGGIGLSTAGLYFVGDDARVSQRPSSKAQAGR